jgi:hypothetical protein
MAGVGHTPFVPVSGLAPHSSVPLPSPHELPAAISLSTPSRRGVLPGSAAESRRRRVFNLSIGIILL